VGTIHYTPTFHPADFVDEVDRIRAGGPKGFNARFHAIEDDLAQFSTVVAEVDAALVAIATGPTEHSGWLPPALLATVGGQPWQLSATGAAQDTPGTSPAGAFSVLPPDGVRLVSLRAIGQCTSGIAVTVKLSRCAYGATAAQELGRMTANGNPFDVTMPVDASLARVATGSFRYFVTATAPTTPTTNTTTVVIAAFQLTYSTAR
jgi:hypothetical protein